MATCGRTTSCAPAAPRVITESASVLTQEESASESSTRPLWAAIDSWSNKTADSIEARLTEAFGGIIEPRRSV